MADLEIIEYALGGFRADLPDRNVATRLTVPEAPDATNQRTTEDALRQLRDQLRQDRDNLQQLGALATPDQRRLLRNTRATLLLIRIVLREFDGAGE